MNEKEKTPVIEFKDFGFQYFSQGNFFSIGIHSNITQRDYFITGIDRHSLFICN